MHQSDATPTWYRERSYAHFDRRPARVRALEYVLDPNLVAKHSFMPSILTPISVSFRTLDGGRRVWTKKARVVARVAHMDGHIHSYYARIIQTRLEEHYREPFGKSIIAYRRFEPPRSNIGLALEAFEEIAARKDVDVVALDVSGFFDNLDHRRLKQSWSQLLSCKGLPDDHYAVYRSITKDYAISWPAVRTALKERYRRYAGPDGSPICCIRDFRELIAPLCQPRHSLVVELQKKQTGVVREPKGIPQGSPISAALANLYMLSTDKQLYDGLLRLGASYRRYSDDILLICPPETRGACEALVIDALHDVGLEISDDKTETSAFRIKPTGRVRVVNTTRRGKVLTGRGIQYLGLVFDGERARLRDSTVGRFHKQVNRVLQRTRLAAKREGSHLKVKRRKIYAALSQLGWGKAYSRPISRGGRTEPPRNAPRLGFVHYATRAHNQAEDRSAIGEQRQRFWLQLHLRIKSTNQSLAPNNERQ